MASKTSKRLSKLTDKMAECKSAQQSRKSRRIAIANAKLSKAMPPPKSIPSPKNTKPPKIVKPIRNTVIVEAPKSVKSTVNPGQVNAEIIKLDVNKSSDTRARIALPDRVKPVERIEFYPEKLKRKRFTKKIVLGPKHNYKVVAAVNKRKSFTPHREGTPQQPTNIVASRFTYKNAQPSTSQSVKDKVAEQANLACPNPVWRVNRPDERSAEETNPQPKKKVTSRFTYKPVQTSNSLTVKDMVMMSDEANLTDEDFMEILTCPSPVWWEDPPNERYVEDPICEIIIEEDDEVKEVAEDLSPRPNQALVNTQTIDKATVINPVDNRQNGVFIRKQRKLESVLCNIVQKLCNTEVKNNVIDNTEKLSNCTDESFDLNWSEDAVKCLENINIPMQN